MTPSCRHGNFAHCELCAGEAKPVEVNTPFEPWTSRPKFVTELDPQATERLVNVFVGELCNLIENRVSAAKSAGPGKSSRRARIIGETEALLAVVHRLQEYGLIRREP